MLRPNVPRTPTVPEPAIVVLALVLSGERPQVILGGPVVLTQKPQGLRVPSGARPHAADTALGLGLTTRRPPITLPKAALTRGQAPTRLPPIRQHELAMEAKATPTPTPRAPVALTRAEIGPKAPPPRLSHAAPELVQLTKLVLRAVGPPPSPLAQVEGAGLVAVVVDVPTRRQKPTWAATGARRPRRVRALAGKCAMVATPVVVVPPLVAIGPRPLHSAPICGACEVVFGLFWGLTSSQRRGAPKRQSRMLPNVQPFSTTDVSEVENVVWTIHDTSIRGVL